VYPFTEGNGRGQLVSNQTGHKSPTEAELIALTDNLGFVELFQEFVEFLMRKRLKH
jgi:hypothetical protein